MGALLHLLSMTDDTSIPAIRQRRRRGLYQVDLTDLHGLCEANYHRLLRLFPGYEQHGTCVFNAGEASVTLEVTSRDRYTTDMRLRYQGTSMPIWQGLHFDMRLYHDARMAEVVNCQTSRRFEARYTYPNPDMLQRDEKFQQNQFAAEFLEFCLNHGLAANASLPVPDIFQP